jgi:glycolate oxidase FAD binding subunit
MTAGPEPRSTVEPPTVEDLAACVGELYARGVPFAFAGGGTERELGNLPRALDTVIKTTACNGLIDSAPQDQTVTLGAGMTLSAAAELLARERQFLAIDAPDPDVATVGGAIATNLYGSRRLRYGSIKDTIVGVEIVRPDGVRARGGGKVVKNVAGFDIPKLMVGSLGTLGAIVSATFRVYPIPEARAALTYACVSAAAVMSVGRELVADALVPAAVTACAWDSGDGYDCRVSFEGFARGVEQQMGAASAIAARLGVRAAANEPAEPGMDERERRIRRAATWRVTLAAQPTALAEFLAAKPLPPGAGHVVYPLLGTAFVGADALDAGTIARWRAALDGGSVVVTAMPPEFRATVDTWGPPPVAAFAVMRRLKDQFDPKGLCNAGRFVGGL